MIFQTYEEQDFEKLYDGLLGICQRAQVNHYLDMKSDFAIDFYNKPTSILHKLYISKKIKYLTCIYINQTDLIAVSGITFENKETAQFAEYLYILPKQRGKLTSSDLFLPQIKLIFELGFSKCICIHKTYKQIIKRYFTKMSKVKALENLVIVEPDYYGVYLNGKMETDSDKYKETIHSSWKI